MYSGPEQVLIEVALPGVPSDRLELVLAPGELVIRGERSLPQRPVGHDPAAPGDPVWTLRAPARRSSGRWELVDRRLADGCLQLLLARR